MSFISHSPFVDWAWALTDLRILVTRINVLSVSCCYSGNLFNILAINHLVSLQAESRKILHRHLTSDNPRMSLLVSQIISIFLLQQEPLEPPAHIMMKRIGLSQIKSRFFAVHVKEKSLETWKQFLFMIYEFLFAIFSGIWLHHDFINDWSGSKHRSRGATCSGKGKIGSF